MTKRRGNTPLSSEELQWLSDFMAKNKLKKMQVAEQISIPKSTFSDILSGKPFLKKNKHKIRDFIRKMKEQAAVAQGGKIITESFVPLGESKPSIPDKKMMLLLVEFNGGADMAISAMTYIVNAKFGDRKFLREILGEKLDILRRLSRALSSEDQLKDVKQELGRETLP